MAHLAKDDGLLDAFRHDLDVHRATAAEVFGVPLEDVSGDQRRSAKAINFGLIYGMSAFGLAKQIGVERKEAQAYIDRYFARYPGVLAYMERTRAQAAEQGSSKPVRPSSVPAGDPFEERRHAQGRRAHRDQRADAGHRGGHHEARHGRCG